MNELFARFKARFFECMVWVAVVIVLAMVETCPCFSFCHQNYWLKSVLPQGNHDGWGGLSFLSVITGLNLALVKLETFIKSLENVKSEWVKGVERKLAGKASKGVLADERTARLAPEVLRNRCTRLIEEINDENSQWWARCRWWAVRCAVAGLMFLFFQFSAGLAGLVLLGPVIGTYLGRLHSTTKLFENVDAGINFKNLLLEMAEQTTATGKREIEQSLAAIPPETPF